MSEDRYGGSMRMGDGTRHILTSEEAEALWKESEARIAKRAEKLPDEQTALSAMFEAYDRLRELGWREACYCPKDGTPFQAIEAGSTGIFDCIYQGEWPTGSYWIADAGDLWPSNPILFRPYPPKDA